MNMSGRVLVVDDEPDVLRLLTFNLERAGFETESAATGADALLTAARTKPAVIVLDLMLPDLSGLEICKQLRADPALAKVGILMLTALGDDAQRVEGLAAGADDYVVKPFNIDEIVLRVRALARRIGESEEASEQDAGRILRCGPISLDPVTHDVRVHSKPISLRPLEYKLLAVMVAEPGRVFGREELIQQVWDMDADEVSNPRLVDVHIRRLRQNLGEGADVVETVPGFGYRATV
jgi:two-component system phosphate regulon response regulator PhoB